MQNDSQIGRNFFERNTVTIARELLGMHLVKIEHGIRIEGIINETEAYCGEKDLGCHAKAGRTPRTNVMYGPAGHAYVYFTYGMHWLLNFVTEDENFPAAVLIRSVIPIKGIEIIAQRRQGRPQSSWTDGPAKLCQAFNIDGQFNGYDLCKPGAILYAKFGDPIADINVTTSPRVGLNNVPEPWKSKPWRFYTHPDFIQNGGLK